MRLVLDLLEEAGVEDVVDGEARPIARSRAASRSAMERSREAAVETTVVDVVLVDGSWWSRNER